jgi:hypothetical protein
MKTNHFKVTSRFSRLALIVAAIVSMAAFCEDDLPFFLSRNVTVEFQVNPQDNIVQSQVRYFAKLDPKSLPYFNDYAEEINNFRFNKLSYQVVENAGNVERVALKLASSDNIRFSIFGNPVEVIDDSRLINTGLVVTNLQQNTIPLQFELTQPVKTAVETLLNSFEPMYVVLEVDFKELELGTTSFYKVNFDLTAKIIK